MQRFHAVLSLILLVVGMRYAAAQAPSVRDPEVIRRDLRGITVHYQEPKGPRGAMIEVARELLIYDASGHLIRHERLGKNGRLEVRNTNTFDASGRLVQTKYRDHTGRVELRRFSYKLDAAGRVSECDLRNPAAPPGEFRRDVYTWEADGSRTVRTFRHYANSGPYPDGSAAYDAAGRPKTRCIGNHCELYEYDAHGEISRVREQNHQTHFYRVHENHYDDSGRLDRQRIGGTETTYRRNSRGDVLEELRQSSGAPSARLIYEYDPR